jgi:hypothetical protein
MIREHVHALLRHLFSKMSKRSGAGCQRTALCTFSRYGTFSKSLKVLLTLHMFYIVSNSLGLWATLSPCCRFIPTVPPQNNSRLTLDSCLLYSRAPSTEHFMCLHFEQNWYIADTMLMQSLKEEGASMMLFQLSSCKPVTMGPLKKRI